MLQTIINKSNSIIRRIDMITEYLPNNKYDTIIATLKKIYSTVENDRQYVRQWVETCYEDYKDMDTKIAIERTLDKLLDEPEPPFGVFREHRYKYDVITDDNQNVIAISVMIMFY